MHKCLMIYYWKNWKTEEASKPPRKSQNQHFLFSFKFSWQHDFPFIAASLFCAELPGMLVDPFVLPPLSLRGSVKLLPLCGVPNYWSQNLGEKIGAGGTTHWTLKGLLDSTPQHINSNFWVNNDVLQAHRTRTALTVISWVRPSLWNVTKR